MRSVTLAFVALSFAVNASARTEGSTQRGSLDLLTSTMLIAKADTKSMELSGHEADTNPYTVQVASYLSESDAAKHVEQLKKHDRTAFYFPTFTRGQVWFKVCSGRYATQDLAEKHRRTLVDKHEEAFAVVISLQNSNLDRKTASDMTVTTIKKETAPVVANVTATVASTNTVPTTESVETTVPKVATEDYQYTVQIASFTKKSEADQRSASLSGEGDVEIKESLINGQVWYRVYLGKFETKREADAFRAVYAEKTGDTQSFVKRLEK
jgi:septal ring-binding cell division protein DamX